MRVDPRARINLGIRRRLASLMDNDRRKIELMNALLLSMPGTPVIYYGDEIGMGDNFYLGDRDGVRTPMQWSHRPQRRLLARRPAAALSAAADGPGLRLPGSQRRVAAERRIFAAQLDAAHGGCAQEPSRIRSRQPSSSFIPSNRRVLAFLREHEGETILCVANLVAFGAGGGARSRRTSAARVPIELTGGSSFPPIGSCAVRADAAGLRLLLVRACRPGSSCRAGTLRRPSRCPN